MVTMTREQFLLSKMREDTARAEFNEQYESQQNGNISSFKEWLSQQDGETIYNFIKWLQAERLSL